MAPCGCRECHPSVLIRPFVESAQGGRDWAMALSFLYLAFVRILQLVRLGRRDSDELAVEVVMLRHEVAVLRRQVVRPALRPPDRALLAGLSRLLDRRRRGRFFVQPETLLRWHRDLIRRKMDLCPPPRSTEHPCRHWCRSSSDWPGRTPLGDTAGSKVKLARMGVVLAPSSVWAILRRNGIDPSPMRSGPTWAEFLSFPGVIDAGL